MVEEMRARVGLVVWRGHEERRRCAQGDDGVVGAEGQREDGGRVVAGEGGDEAVWVEVVAAAVVGAYHPQGDRRIGVDGS